MVNSFTALLVILGYGLVIGIAGLAFAARERGLRRKAGAAGELFAPSALASTLHGRLRTDSGEEMEVYFQSASR
jgi:hypothetical protein